MSDQDAIITGKTDVRDKVLNIGITNTLPRARHISKIAQIEAQPIFNQIK
jgi:hypothetical protein